MDNAYCHEEYGVTIHQEGKDRSKEMTFDDKLVIGGYILSLIVLSTFVLYGIPHGLNVDLLSLK
ncbi:hypothetical protein Ga0466249_002502 [Sporomusaceae bacterium BoRhaA]|uniref:hypothetical protein n=1 Tax=Pelorhabdus rhamnosifermentans TaxID=2772457 RepID=UPI001C05F0BD|nr:hypothetical protein [Pelorhabdus rhamnosifermentans]MBU2701388.1 hypothetical protein [Pelorhabdus rhamnosifermentans]